MAKGGSKGSKRSKGKKPRKAASVPRSRTGAVVEGIALEEVTAKRAFITSFVMLSLFLAPVLGLGMYFARESDMLSAIFSTREWTFLGGMFIGILIAFVMSIVFTRKAVAHS